jgi:hypothetical protein
MPTVETLLGIFKLPQDLNGNKKFKMSKKLNLSTHIISVLVFGLVSCKQNVIGVILEKESRMPIESVSISGKDLRLNSYPFTVVNSDKHGHFKFEKKSKDSLLFFWKLGYKNLKLKVVEGKPIDTIYMEKEN